MTTLTSTYKEMIANMLVNQEELLKSLSVAPIKPTVDFEDLANMNAFMEISTKVVAKLHEVRVICSEELRKSLNVNDFINKPYIFNRPYKWSKSPFGECENVSDYKPKNIIEQNNIFYGNERADGTKEASAYYSMILPLSSNEAVDFVKRVENLEDGFFETQDANAFLRNGGTDKYFLFVAPDEDMEHGGNPLVDLYEYFLIKI